MTEQEDRILAVRRAEAAERIAAAFEGQAEATRQVAKALERLCDVVAAGDAKQAECKARQNDQVEAFLGQLSGALMGAFANVQATAPQPAAPKVGELHVLRPPKVGELHVLRPISDVRDAPDGGEDSEQ